MNKCYRSALYGRELHVREFLANFRYRFTHRIVYISYCTCLVKNAFTQEWCCGAKHPRPTNSERRIRRKYLCAVFYVHIVYTIFCRTEKFVSNITAPNVHFYWCARGFRVTPRIYHIAIDFSNCEVKGISTKIGEIQCENIYCDPCAERLIETTLFAANVMHW